MSAYSLYLVAKAYNISVDWLLGLSDVKIRNKDGFIGPATYGDVLTFLDNLFKKGTAIISNCADTPWVLDESLNTIDGPVLPEFIQIKDEYLFGLIHKLNCARLELNDKNYNIRWKDTLMSEKLNPLPYIQDHDGQQSDSSEQPEPSDQRRQVEQPAGTPEKAMNYEAFKKNTAKRLEILNAGMTYNQFADTLKVSKSTVSDWINCKHMPEIPNLCSVTKTFKKTADWILGLDDDEDRIKFYRNEGSTYGSVLYILNHLIEKRTIGIVTDIADHPNEPDCDKPPKIDGLYTINDDFLVCLLLRLETLKRHSGDGLKKEMEYLFDKYKDINLLSINENTIHISREKVHKLRKGGLYQNIDLDKLYEELQALK